MTDFKIKTRKLVYYIKRKSFDFCKNKSMITLGPCACARDSCPDCQHRPGPRVAVEQHLFRVNREQRRVGDPVSVCVSQHSQLSAPTQQQTRPAPCRSRAAFIRLRVIENQLAHAQKPGELCLCYAIPPLPCEAAVVWISPTPHPSQ